MWNEVEKRFGKEIDELKKQIKDYEYSEKHAVRTDEKIRSLFLDKLKKSKTSLSDIIELAYKEKADELSDLKTLRDDINLAANDVDRSNFGKFPKEKKTLEKILLKDVLLLNDINSVKELIDLLYNKVTNSQVQNLPKDVQEIRKVLRSFRENFEERKTLIRSEFGK